jgi:hypothetical protein
MNPRDFLELLKLPERSKIPKFYSTVKPIIVIITTFLNERYIQQRYKRYKRIPIPIHNLS